MRRHRFLSRVAWGLALALATILVVHVPNHPSSEAAAPLVCLDPGHGGSAPGAVNGGLREADINLDVANALAARLAADGIDSVLTRTDDSA